MTNYVVGIDRGTNQDGKILNDVCSYLKKCSGGTVTSLGIGPNKVQSYCLGAQAKGKTAVYIANGVGVDTPQDFELGIGKYYHCDKCIFVWPQFIGNQYMSNSNILNHTIPREHDFTSVQFGIGGKFTAAKYFSQTRNVSLVSGTSSADIAQRICNGAFVTESGNPSSSTANGLSSSQSSNSTNSTSSSASNTSPLLNGEMTFEELVGEICNGIDLMFLCKRSTVVVTDFESIFAEAKYLRDNYNKSVKSENVNLWQIEEDSYELNINQHGFYNTVYVKYDKGTVREAFDDLVRVYGEIPITYEDRGVNKSTAIMKAKAYLAAHLRDLEITVNTTMMTDADIDIGDIITIENPKTKTNEIKILQGSEPEFLFTKGVNTSWEGDSYISTDLECQFSPTSPKKLEVPTVGTNSSSNSTSNNQSVSSSNETYGKCGVSSDGKTICAIGKPSASGETSKYGYTFYRSVFKNKCPFCGGTNLVWGIFWAGNESGDYGYLQCKGSSEGGSAEGHIFCKDCDADFSCILGKDHMSPPRATLTRADSGPVKCTKEDAYNLKKGTYSF